MSETYIETLARFINEMRPQTTPVESQQVESSPVLTQTQLDEITIIDAAVKEYQRTAHWKSSWAVRCAREIQADIDHAVRNLRLLQGRTVATPVVDVVTQTGEELIRIVGHESNYTQTFSMQSA